MSNQSRDGEAAARSGRKASIGVVSVADPRARGRHLLLGFAICAAIVFARVVQLELSQGGEFRAAAAQPIAKRRPIAANRGPIVSRDGMVLATDVRIASLAVHYRLLEDPPNQRWLRRQARARVASDVADRAASLAAANAWMQEYRSTLLDRLARLCGRPLDDLQSEATAIQQRVQAIAAAVNRAHVARLSNARAALAAEQKSWQEMTALLPSWLLPANSELPPPRMIVSEELDYHVIVPDVPLEIVAEVESRPEDYPGVRIVEQSRRHYPHSALAANVLGHLGPPDEDSVATEAPQDDVVTTEPAPSRRRFASGPVGRMGVERQFEQELHGRDGELLDLTDHGGRLLSSIRRSEPVGGQTIALTLDARLQQLAEQRLDQALTRLERESKPAIPGGGAVVILDVQTGAILAAATAPRFNPNLFAHHDPQALAQLLRDPRHPLFDRTTKMAIPPGSVFKIVTALALLDQPGFDPEIACECQGFLARPDRERCQIFRRYGLGHGATTLSDALARSCNVYFFQHAAQLGPAVIADWGDRLGFGRATGVDLPNENSGILPYSGTQSPDWQAADTRALAIGQSRLTATPLQVARLMAVIANGGFLVSPHVVASNAPSSRSEQATRIPGLRPPQISLIRQALERAVADPEGTAYAALADCGVTVAGKTGTAETGEHSADHAWFAGYAPADTPRVALAIALEHRGSADLAATIAKEVLQGMAALDLLTTSPGGVLAQAEHE